MPPPIPPPFSPTPPGGASSGSTAGMAGMDRLAARSHWAENSRHALKAPGAYEWWYFEAIAPNGDGVVIALFEGLPFHPSYLTRVSRHLHRTRPTPFDRVGAELLASFYPAAYIAAYQGGKRVAQSLNIYPPNSARGELDNPDIRIGPNTITLRQDGTFGIIARGYPFEVRHAQPMTRKNQTLSAALTFNPMIPEIAHVRRFRPSGSDGAGHTWVLAAPHGRVTGNVQLIRQNEGICDLDIRVDANGYHDHVYGHGTLGSGVQKIMWGYLQGDNWTVAWHQTFMRGVASHHADGIILFERGTKPVVLEGPSSKLEQQRLNNWLMGHPGKVLMHGSTAQGHSVELQIVNEHVVDKTPFHSRVTATGSLNIPGYRQYQGRGSTHIMNLRRLKWPVVSDLVLMAITAVSEDDPLWRE